MKEVLENLSESLTLVWSFGVVAFERPLKKQVCPKYMILDINLRRVVFFNVIFNVCIYIKQLMVASGQHRMPLRREDQRFTVQASLHGIKTR